MTRSERIPDIVALATLVALTGVFAARLVNFGIPPFEDAAMLMRYAEHLAHGWGVVWNLGEAPLDGATDFLFMVVVAAVTRVGVTIETSVRIVTVVSHFATVCLIYVGMRQVQRSGVAAAFLSALYFAVGPGLFLSAAYFGTPMFALGVALAWLLAQRLLLPEGRSVRAYTWFSVACLVLGLIRPEGVLISVFMLSAVGVLLPRAESSRLTAVFAGVFALLGVTYFVWRWQYFGHPLPNPFYKKGGGLHVSALKSSVKNSLSLGWPFIPMWLLATRSRVALRQGLAFLLPIVGATCMWVLISDEMNFGARFQYPILVLYVLSWYPLVRGVSAELGLRTSVPLTAMQRVAMALAVGAVVGPVFARQVSNARRITYSHDGRLDIGLMLKQYADRGYTIATTEAGLLPLYSQWHAIDTWGLNDRWIAENGGLTKEYLSRRKPDILMWHGAVSPHSAPSAESAESWSRQGMILKEYADERDFTLAAAFGRVPEDTHYYYVRPDLPEHDEIVRAIRGTAYRWFDSGEECTNFAGSSSAYPSDAPSNPVADVDRPRR